MSYQFSVDLTAAQFDGLKEKLASTGIDTTKTSGTTPETQGVVLNYALASMPNGDTTIAFTIEKKPWIVSNGFVEGKVKSMIGVA